MTTETINKFKQFLKDERITTKFFDNAYGERSEFLTKKDVRNLDYIPEDLPDKVAIGFLIMGAFTWNLTSEGFDFWYGVSQRWMITCDMSV